MSDTNLFLGQGQTEWAHERSVEQSKKGRSDSIRVSIAGKFKVAQHRLMYL